MSCVGDGAQSLDNKTNLCHEAHIGPPKAVPTPTERHRHHILRLWTFNNHCLLNKWEVTTLALPRGPKSGLVSFGAVYDRGVYSFLSEMPAFYGNVLVILAVRTVFVEILPLAKKWVLLPMEHQMLVFEPCPQ